jgi:hypothetical protein
MSTKSDWPWRAVSLLGFVMSAAALTVSLLLWSRAGEKPAASAATPAVAAPAPTLALAGRTATLSRLLAERRAVARIEISFRANGALDAACRAEAADGAEAPCFGEAKGTGTWSMQGTRLCLVAPVINLASERCYDVSGEAPSLRLAGPDFLAGSLMLR